MEIFIIRDGRQAGPFSEGDVRAFLTEGTARPIDMGWCKGMPDWKPLAELLKPRTEEPSAAATPPPAAAREAEEVHIPATAKQKAFLKYLGAEFGENLTKERAALAISDAMETPKLQVRIRKWHDDKVRMHAELFQDEIDFRKANRTARYLERVQTEGSEVLHDVTKAHVQVLVESLDKKHPSWESEPESALWDYLLPALGEHFPQLVQPAHKGNLKTASAVKTKSSLVDRSSATGRVSMAPAANGTFGAMIRGVVFGILALGAIIFGYQKWQESRERGTPPAASVPTPVAPEKTDAAPPLIPAPEPVSKEPPTKLIAETKDPEALPENPPVPAPEAVAPLVVPNDPPAPAMIPEKPAAAAPPEEKPAVPAPPMTPEVPAPPVVAIQPPAPAPAPVPRASVKLTQGIGVTLLSGQVTLPAGTVLRYLATEGPNVRVSWNNNVFFVPAMATDMNEPLRAPGQPSVPQPAPGTPPAAPAMPPASPKKPSDDL